MLVDVVRLRRNGLKLPAEEVKSATPIRGRLQVTHVRPGYRNHRVQHLHAMLIDERFEFAVPMLEPAIIKRIDHRGMLIVGVEHVPGYVRKTDEYTYPQAWWCLPVTVQPSIPETP